MRLWIILFVLLAALPAYPQERCDLLVWPVFGVVPPEMKLPTAGQVADALRPRLPKDLVVAAEEPTVTQVPEDVVKLARNRGRELRARVVIWGELQPPGNCPAPRAMRVQILDLKADVLLQRKLCPKNFVRRRITRSILRLVGFDVILGLRSTVRKKKSRKKPHPVARPFPCPDPPPCPQLECPRPEPEPASSRARGFLAAGFLFSSHPSWESGGVGSAIELSWSPLSWLEAGLGLQAHWSRSIDEEAMQATYVSWPLAAWGRIRFGRGPLEGLVDLGLQAGFTRLEKSSGAERRRVKPAAILRLGVRWMSQGGPGLQCTAGTSVYFSGQSYGGYSMPWYSFELAASLVVPVW